METKQLSGGKVEIWTDAAHVIRKIGDNTPTQIRRRRVNVSELDEWEEVAAEAVPQYSHEEYCREVERLIALRYSHGREIEVNRERDEKPERFAEYMAYVTACKVQAKELLTGDSSSTGEPQGQESAAEEGDKSYNSDKSDNSDKGDWAADGSC